jgi:hypothetical protein
VAKDEDAEVLTVEGRKVIRRGCAMEGCHSSNGFNDFRLRRSSRHMTVTETWVEKAGVH